jgi:hypothetical protein
LIEKALRYIAGMADPKTTEVNGKVFSKGALTPVVPASEFDDPIQITTLKALVDLVDAGFEGIGVDLGAVVVHVVNPKRVEVLAAQSDEYGRRPVYIVAEPLECKGFTFGEFMGHESFMIGLASNFQDTEDRDYLLKFAAKLSSASTVAVQDDGVSQQVYVAKGVVLKENETTRPRLVLAPFRTFPDIEEQPRSEYVFRLRPRDGQLPVCALFEADGGAWQLKAMDEVAAFLAGKVQIPVIA